MAFRQKWEGFEKQMKAKREVNCKRRLKGQTPKKVDQLTVQRLSSDVSGKAQKFSRIGPREFVPYPYGDLTLTNIKKACEDHFLSQLKMQVECDVLAGEQGPSCKTLDQIPNLKLIHVRFVGTTMKYSSKDLDSSSKDSVSPPTGKKRYEVPDSRTSCCLSEIHSRQTQSLESHPKPKDKTANVYPKSLSVTQMLNLGKVLQRKSIVAEIFKFNLEDMNWSSIPEKVELVIEKEPFAKGGFREVFKAKSPTKGYNGCTWVVKKYLPSTLQCIKDLGQTVEEHTKKTVQMQSLAKNITERLYARVNDVCKDEFGQSFVYTDIFMGKLELQEFVTVEKFIDGDFSKYINNTGTSSSTTQYVGIAQVISARKLNASLTILMRNLHSR